MQTVVERDEINMKVVVAIDSLKGSLSSLEAGYAISEGIHKVFPKAEVTVRPLADGGEGTGVILSKYLGLEMLELDSVNAFNKKITVKCGSNGEIAAFDVASIVGFDANEGEKLDPSIATTFGIGIVIKKLIELGHKKIYVGLGGSILIPCFLASL